jgi:hypothetical protein
MKQREGELMIDHTFSPGMPAALVHQLGFGPGALLGGRKLEAATLTCAHCKTVAVKNLDRTRPRASCVKCGGKYLCDNCGATAAQPLYQHASFEAKRDAAIERFARSPLTL